MNPSLLFLLVLFGKDCEQPPKQAHLASAIIGTWKLQAVHHVVRPAAGAPAYPFEARLTPGVTTVTYLKGHQWLLKDQGVIRKRGTYSLRGRELETRVSAETKEDKEEVFQEEVRELSVTRLVTFHSVEQPDGSFVDVTETHVR